MQDTALKNCSISLTVARAFALISIVCAHITFRDPCSTIISRSYTILASIGVIAYLFMSGFFYNTKKFPTFFSMLKAKFISIGIPWLFLGSVLYFYNSIVSHIQISPLEWFKWIIGYKTYLYFLTILFLCFIIFYKTGRIFNFLCIPISIISLFLTASGTLNPIMETLHITNYLNIFNWLGVFSFGKIIGELGFEKFYGFICKVRWIIIPCFLIGFFIVYYFNIPVSYFSYLGIYWEVLGALFIFCLSSFNIFHIPLLEKIANNSFAIYLIHMAIIGISGRIYNYYPPITQVLAVFFIIGVCHFLLELCRFGIRKIGAEKYLNVLFGFRNRKIS